MDIFHEKLQQLRSKLDGIAPLEQAEVGLRARTHIAIYHIP
jgi:hypothetical protein